MSKRQCADCGGELMLAMRSGQQIGPSHRPGLVKTVCTYWRPYWRCTTCGHAFTAEQVRQGERNRRKP